MTRRLFTLDEVRDNFDCVVSLAVAGGLWSDDVAQVVAALGAGFGLALELPHAAATTTIESCAGATFQPAANTPKSPDVGTFQGGSTNAEAARLLAAMMRLAQVSDVLETLPKNPKVEG